MMVLDADAECMRIAVGEKHLMPHFIESLRKIEKCSVVSL